MVDNVQPGVERLIDAPDEREGVTLIVGVEDASSDVITDRIEGTGATVEASLYYDNLAVAIDEETDLDALCSLDGVTSVEIEGVWEPMGREDEGNSHTPGTARKQN